MIRIGREVNPAGRGNFRQSSRPSWQRAQTWQKTCVAKSHVDSHCSRLTSSSTQLPQHPHDLLSASQLPCSVRPKENHKIKKPSTIVLSDSTFEEEIN